MGTDRTAVLIEFSKVVGLRGWWASRRSARRWPLLTYPPTRHWRGVGPLRGGPGRAGHRPGEALRLEGPGAGVAGGCRSSPVRHADTHPSALEVTQQDSWRLPEQQATAAGRCLCCPCRGGGCGIPHGGGLSPRRGVPPNPPGSSRLEARGQEGVVVASGAGVWNRVPSSVFSCSCRA